MAKAASHQAPVLYKGVMLSSTFTDLKEHRKSLIEALKGQGLTDVAMETDTAKPAGDVVDSSLAMGKVAAFAPIPSPRESTTSRLRSGDLARLRTA